MNVIRNTTPTTDQAAAVDPLDQLAAEAGAATSGTPAAPGAPAAAGDQAGQGDAPPLSNTDAIMAGVGVMRETLCGFAKLKSPRETMADDLMRPGAVAVAAVLDKYGINLSGMAGGYLVEIQAAMVVVPIVLTIRSGIQSEMAARREAAANTLPDASAATLVHG